MHINRANIHRLKPSILHRDEVLNYISLANHQHFIITPCESDLEFKSSRSKFAKSYINESRMVAAAKQLTIRTTSWLTAQDLNNIRLRNSDNSLEHPDEWILSKRIFSVEIAETEFIPFYALDPEKNFSPYVVLTEIIQIFAEQKNSWSIAFWFGTANGFLGGQRPKNLLKTQPELVLSAAIDEAAGITHG
jgi:hypothetical protein